MYMYEHFQAVLDLPLTSVAEGIGKILARLQEASMLLSTNTHLGSIATFVTQEGGVTLAATHTSNSHHQMTVHASTGAPAFARTL